MHLWGNVSKEVGSAGRIKFFSSFFSVLNNVGTVESSSLWAIPCDLVVRAFVRNDLIA